MATHSQTLAYRENHHSKFWADWFANFSVLCFFVPFLTSVGAFLALLLGGVLIENHAVVEHIINVFTMASPFVGLSFGITSLALKTTFKKTAISGIIGCSLLIVIFILGVVLKGEGFPISRGRAIVVVVPPPAAAPAR